MRGISTFSPLTHPCAPLLLRAVSILKGKMTTEKEEYRATSVNSFPQISEIWVNTKRFTTKLTSFNIWVSHLRISLQGCWKCQLGGGRISSFIVSKCKTFPYFRQYFPDLISIISFHYFALKIFQNFCQYFWVLISSPLQEMFFWRLVGGINQINWIVCSSQPWIRFPHFCAAPFLDIHCNSCRYIYHFTPTTAKAGWAKTIFLSFVHPQKYFNI